MPDDSLFFNVLIFVRSETLHLLFFPETLLNLFKRCCCVEFNSKYIYNLCFTWGKHNYFEANHAFIAPSFECFLQRFYHMLILTLFYNFTSLSRSYDDDYPASLDATSAPPALFDGSGTTRFLFNPCKYVFKENKCIYE